jgi:pimeloyl-ACP methyl ester carboxylesterase
MTRYEELDVTIDGVRTRVLKGGSGPDLLYWHGAGACGRWFPHHDVLAESFTVYAPDHPGWGMSDSPEWMDTMQDYVLHHDALLRALRIERPVLVGHSLGGWMAAEFAVTYPDRIAALALVNAAGFPFDTEEVPDFFAVAARGGPEFAQMLFHKMDVAAAFFPTEVTAEDRLRMVHELTSTARLGWHIWYETKLPRRLSRLTAPTLILWGAHERLFPVALARKYAAAIPGARLTILEDCGHMVPFENTAAFCQAIVELAELYVEGAH